MSDAPASTHDTVFLAITRPAMAYGVPLGGFLLAAGAAGMVFNFTHAYNVFWRFGLVGAAFAAVITAMRVLTSWEPNWFSILTVWSRTRAPALLSPATWRYGGTTVRPGPTDLTSNMSQVRDYAG